MKLKNYFNFSDNRKSFTLIELLVVIAIIGLLASIVIVNLTGTRSKASVARGLQFSQSVHHALGSEAAGIWSFDEGSGTTAYDASGYGNNGTINGASYMTDTPSNTGYALSFDGSSGRVRVPHSSSLQITGDVTMSVWTYNKRPTTQIAYIAAKGNTSTNQRAYMLSINALSEPSYNFWVSVDGSTRDHVTYTTDTLGAPGPDLHKWTNIIGVYDQANRMLYLYRNGQLVVSKSTTISGIYASPVDFFIATNDTQAAFWQGYIDDVRVYSIALSSARIESLYYAGLDNLLAKGLINQEEYQERLALR